MIQISNLTKKFPAVTALDNISLTVNNGEFFGLLGPNGAGKSTLMSLLVGYLDPDGGTIHVGGETMNRDSLETRKKIGLVPQSLAIYDDISAQDNLEIFGSFFDIDKTLLASRIKERLDAVHLYDRRKDKVKTFSGGMKRRLNLISSLLHDPPLLLCDEPTVGVDPQSRNAIFDFLQMLNKQGKTIVYTTHYMEEVERLCSRVAIIESGKVIAEGTLDTLLGRLAYEESIRIQKNPSTIEKIDLFKHFGSIIDNESHFELKPNDNFKLSELFANMERNALSYKFIELRKPTLEALFLQLTGRTLRD
jgi:ABC-2 type transport system ATP-binding protein